MDGNQDPVTRLTRQLAVVRLPVDFTTETIIYAKDLIILIIAPVGCLACYGIAIVWIYTIQVIPEFLLFTAHLLEACLGVGVPKAGQARGAVIEEVEEVIEEVATEDHAQHTNPIATFEVTHDTSAQPTEEQLEPPEDQTAPTKTEHDLARSNVVSTISESADLTVNLRTEDDALNAKCNDDLEDIVSWSSADEDDLLPEARDRSRSPERTASLVRSATPEHDYYAADRREATSSKIEQQKFSANSEWIARVTGATSKPEQTAKSPVFGSGHTISNFDVSGANSWKSLQTSAETVVQRPRPGFTKEQLAAAAADAAEFTRGGNKARPEYLPRSQQRAARPAMRTAHNRPPVKPTTFVPPRPQPSKPTSAPTIKNAQYSAENLPPHKRKQLAAKDLKFGIDHNKNSAKTAEPVVTKNIHEVLSIQGSAPNSPKVPNSQKLSEIDEPLPTTREVVGPGAVPGQASASNSTHAADTNAQSDPPPSSIATSGSSVIAQPVHTPEQEAQDKTHPRGLSHGDAPMLTRPVARTMSIHTLKALSTRALAHNANVGSASNACGMCGDEVPIDPTAPADIEGELVCSNCRAVGSDVQEAQVIVGKARTAFHRRKPSPTCVKCGSEGHRSVYCPMLEPVQEESTPHDSAPPSNAACTKEDNKAAETMEKIAEQVLEESTDYGSVANSPLAESHLADVGPEETNRPRVVTRLGADFSDKTILKSEARTNNKQSFASSAPKQLDLLDLEPEYASPQPAAIPMPADRHRRTSTLVPSALPFFVPSSRESSGLGSTREQPDVPDHAPARVASSHQEHAPQPQTEYDGWFGGPIATYASADDYEHPTLYDQGYTSNGCYTSPSMQSAYYTSTAPAPPSDCLRPARSNPLTIKPPVQQKATPQKPTSEDKVGQHFAPHKVTIAELFGPPKPSVNADASRDDSQPELPRTISTTTGQSRAVDELANALEVGTLKHQPTTDHTHVPQGHAEETVADLADVKTAATNNDAVEVEDSASEASGYVPESSDSASPQDHAKAVRGSPLTTKVGRADGGVAPMMSANDEELEVPYVAGSLLDRVDDDLHLIGETIKPSAVVERHDKKVEVLRGAPAVEELSTSDAAKPMKQQKREAREELTKAWWMRENARKQVKGTFSLERMQTFESATREYGQQRAALISLMGNGQLNGENAKLFPALTIHDMGEPKIKPPQPDTSASSTASKGLQTERAASPESTSRVAELHELLGQADTALKHYYDAVDFFKGTRPQGRQNKATLMAQGNAKADRAKKYYKKKLDALNAAFADASDEAGYPPVDELEVPHVGDIGAACKCRYCKRHQVTRWT